MKRTMLIAAAIAVLMTVAVAAQPFRGGNPGVGFAQEQEETTLTGRITLAAGELPVLISGGESYTLRISPALAEDLQVSNNAQATITGFLRETRARDLLTTEKVLMVRSIETGGTRYVMAGGGMAGGGMAGSGMAGGRMRSGGFEQFGGTSQFGRPNQPNPRGR